MVTQIGLRQHDTSERNTKRMSGPFLNHFDCIGNTNGIDVRKILTANKLFGNVWEAMRMKVKNFALVCCVFALLKI